MKSGTCTSIWRSPSALMTACGTSWNTGSVSLPAEAFGEAQGLLYLIFRENLEIALGKNFADFTALWSAFLHLLLTVSNAGTGTIPLPLWWYLIQRVTLLTADQTRSGPQNPDFSSIRNLFIRCLLTTVPWSCDWHVLEPGLQGLPQPLTEVAFLPTLSPRLLTLGGQTFHMPLSCQN